MKHIILLTATVVLTILCKTHSVFAQQPQIPDAGTVFAGGTNYDWVPYTGAPTPFVNQWSPENVGTPSLNHAADDTRMGCNDLFADNSIAIIAGAGTTANPEDMFVAALDRPGEVK